MIIFRSEYLWCIFLTFTLEASFFVTAFVLAIIGLSQKPNLPSYFKLVQITDTKCCISAKQCNEHLPGVNFINVLRTAFVHVDPECTKKTVKSALSFCAFGLCERKSCSKNVDEFKPWCQFHQHL